MTKEERIKYHEDFIAKLIEKYDHDEQGIDLNLLTEEELHEFFWDPQQYDLDQKIVVEDNITYRKIYLDEDLKDLFAAFRADISEALTQANLGINTPVNPRQVLEEVVDLLKPIMDQLDSICDKGIALEYDNDEPWFI